MLKFAEKHGTSNFVLFYVSIENVKFNIEIYRVTHQGSDCKNGLKLQKYDDLCLEFSLLLFSQYLTLLKLIRTVSAFDFDFKNFFTGFLSFGTYIF